MPFARRSVSIWVNCLEDTLITHFFWSAILVELCVTLFFLINSLNFRIYLDFVNQKDLLHKFSWIFSARWNSSGVIGSKILKVCIFPLNMRNIIIYVARLWEKYLSKRNPLKHTCSCRDKLIVLWILNRQAKIFLRISKRIMVKPF